MNSEFYYKLVKEHNNGILLIELVLNEYKKNTKIIHKITDNSSNFAKAFRYNC